MPESLKNEFAQVVVHLRDYPCEMDQLSALNASIGSHVSVVAEAASLSERSHLTVLYAIVARFTSDHYVAAHNADALCSIFTN